MRPHATVARRKARIMQRIVPCLWFDHTAAEAADFYVSVFPDARILDTHHYPTEGLPDWQKDFAGKPLSVDFELSGYHFIALNAGPEFTINPSISFMVNFDPSRDPDAREHLDTLWAALAEGGEVHMPLDSYDFSPRYGWVQDRFGVNWQLILTNPDGEERPTIVPSLMFSERVENRAREAIDFYTQVFGGRVGFVAPYPAQQGPANAGSVMFGDFDLLGQWFAAMDSAVDQDFTFNCAVSLVVECADQAEIDRYWEQLSSVPDAEQCGWCADRFGVSWQIVPVNMAELMSKPGAYDQLLRMKKLEIAAFG
ncbi:MAG TPA: VOC family protein [Propionibacteriaceae bacterium]|nr:VOC family protein [Propionibacteriaceae bacterium]